MIRHSIPLKSSNYSYHGQAVQLQVFSLGQVSQLFPPSIPPESQISIDFLRRQSAWVSWSSNLSLRFNISVQIQSHLLMEEETDTILNQMGKMLGGAALWTDLRLTTKLQSSTIQTQVQGHTLNISLRIQSCLDQFYEAELRGLPLSVRRMLDPNPYIQPPPGIPAAHLHEVHIMLDFSESLAGPSLSRNISHKAQWKLPVSQQGLFQDISSQELPQLEDPDDLWESLDADFPFSSQESTATFSSRGSCDSIPTSDTKPNILRPSIAPFMIAMLDVAFRNLITPSFKGSGYGIREELGENRIQFEEFSPGIFNLSLGSAVFSRSLFIPLITKAISSIINSSDSPILRSKVNTLKDMYSCDPSEENSQASSITAVEKALKCLLWRKMQNTLHSTRKRPRLTSLLEQTNATLPPKILLPDNGASKPVENIHGTGKYTGEFFCFDEDIEDAILFSDDEILLSEDDYYEENINRINFHHKPFLETFGPISAIDEKKEFQEAFIPQYGDSSDEFQPSSSPMLLEADNDERIPSSPIALFADIQQDFDLDLKLDSVTKDTEMDMLESSSPIIFPSPMSLPANHGYCGRGSFSIAKLDGSSDAEMLI